LTHDAMTTPFLFSTFQLDIGLLSSFVFL